MNRTDGVAQERLPQMIAQLQTDMTELKNRQRTSGSSGVLGYLTQNNTTWDLTGTVGLDADTSPRTTHFLMTFTGDGSQSPVMANLSFAVFVNGTDVTHQLTAAVNGWTDGAGHDASLQFDSSSEVALTYTQTFYIITDKRIDYYIKAYAVGSSPGTVSVVLVP